MATFITSKSVGQNVTTVRILTNSGYWKSNHNGVDSPVYNSGLNLGSARNLQVTNSNGEFTIIPCDASGNPTGAIEIMRLGIPSVNNQITSFDGTGLTSLTYLDLRNNLLTSFDGTGLSSLTTLNVSDNLLTPSANNQILNLLDQYGLENGQFITTGGRTSSGTADYDALVAKGWTLSGLDLITPPPSGNGKLRIKGVNSGGGTTTTTTTISYPQFNSSSSDYITGTNTRTEFGMKGMTNLVSDVSFNSSNILSYIDSNTDATLEIQMTNINDQELVISGNWELSIQNGDVLGMVSLFMSNIIPITHDDIELRLVNTTTGEILESRSLVNGTITGGVLPTTTTTTSGPTFTFFNRNSSGGISNTLIEVYKINEKDRTVIMIDSGLTDTNGYFYSYVAVGGKFEYAFKCYDTTDNLGNLTWGGIAMAGNTHARPLTRNVYYNITVYSTFDSNPVQNLPINLTEYFGSGALNDILDISPNNRGLIGTTDENGNITGNIMADFQLHFGSDEFTDGNGVLYRSEELVFIPQNQNSYDGGANLQPKYATWNLLGVPGTNNLNVLDQIDNDGNFITNILSTTSEGFTATMLIDGVNYKLSVYDGTDNPPTTEPIYTETWTAVWGVDHVTDLSTTTTTTTEAPTTTTTTTEPVFYTYDFTSLTFAHGEFSNQFNKEGVTNWDGTYRIVATNLNIGTLVYYIGTDGNKHLFTFDIPVIEDASNFININQTGIYDKPGTVTFDSVTPFV